MSRAQASISWFKQTLGWSNSRESWIERLVAAALLLCLVGLGFLGTRANAYLTVTLWTVLAVAAAVLLRRGWLKLFGPVLFYDMLCTARRGRYSLIRCAYSLFLLAVLFWSWMLTFEFGRQTGREQAGMIAMNYFQWFTLVQLIAAFLLTPAYVAGSIAEEKDRKTLEFLLATDLRNREIVLSKFGSRISNLALFVVTGLPILSFLQFLGGVDPDLVLASFAVVGLSVLGLASVGILNSVMLKRPRDAIAMTYFMAIGYLAVATVAFMFKFSSFWLFAEPIWLTDWFFANPPTYGDLVDVLNSGNVIAVIVKVELAGTRGGPGMAAGSLATIVPDLVWAYFLFHGSVCLICLTWSVLRLRVVALKQSYGKTQKLGWLKRFRPPVGNLPVLWKELNIEGGLRVNWLAWLFAIVLVLLTLGSGIWIVIYYFWEMFFNPNAWHGEFYMMMNGWTRTAGTFVACLTLLGVAVRASTTIRSEIDKDTFDALVTTPMSSHAILLAKFVGCIFSVRFGWLWLGSILALGTITEGIFVLALPMFLGAWVIYAVFFTMIGLWFSMVSHTTMRATVYTVLTSIGLSVGHWLIWMCCGPMLFLLNFNHNNGGRIPEYLAKFQAGITPPFVFAWFAYPREELARGMDRREFGELMGFSLLGLFLYTMASLMIWFVMIGPKFRQLTRRNQSSSEAE
jgi:ABC-type transport system involved in multi-copper enzyme maturation permease subunit